MSFPSLNNLTRDVQNVIGFDEARSQLQTRAAGREIPETNGSIISRRRQFGSVRRKVQSVDLNLPGRNFLKYLARLGVKQPDHRIFSHSCQPCSIR